MLITLLYFTGGQILESQLRQRILDEFNFLEFEYLEDGPDELLEEIEERLEKNQQAWRYLYSVQAPNGEWVFDSLPSSPTEGWFRTARSNDSALSLIYTKQLAEGYRLSVGLDETDLQAYRHAFFTSAGWLLATGIVISMVFGLLVYWRFITIVRKLGLPVQQFSEGNFSVRITALHAGPDLDRLTSNINAMFVHTERLIEQLKKLSANIAHDLRTPLTRVKNQLEIARTLADQNCQLHLHRADQELDDVLRLLREILQLSEIQSGRLQTHFEKLDLVALIHGCVELYTPLLEQQHITCRIHLPNQLLIKGSPQLLKQVLVNLLENTLSHSVGNCLLEILLSTTKRNIALQVHDTGEAKEDKSAHKHFGLGLNFVTAITELHGGNATFETDHSLGFCCKIELPLKILIKPD